MKTIGTPPRRRQDQKGQIVAAFFCDAPQRRQGSKKPTRGRFLLRHLQRTRCGLRSTLFTLIIDLRDVVGLVSLLLDLVDIDVPNSIVTIEELCELFKCWSTCFDEEHVNEDKLDSDPDLFEISCR